MTMSMYRRWFSKVPGLKFSLGKSQGQDQCLVSVTGWSGELSAGARSRARASVWPVWLAGRAG